MSRNAKPLTDADPTYPSDATNCAGQLALDNQVPRLDVAPVQLLIGDRVARLGHAWQRHSARADVGAADRGNADRGAQRCVWDTRRDIPGTRGDGLEAVDALEHATTVSGNQPRSACAPQGCE